MLKTGGKGGNIMPVMDEFRKEREELMQKGFKEKLSYFLYYYKWHTLAAIAVIAIIVSIVTNIVTRKDSAFYVCLLNTLDTPQSEDYVQSFAEYAGIDTKEYDVEFDTSMMISGDGRDEISIATYQRLTVYTAAGDMDALISPPEIVDRYAAEEVFYDLRDLLTSEETSLYEPYFYYVTNQETGDSIPVGIRLVNCQKLKENFLLGGDDMIVGVYVNSKNVETAVKFIEFIMQEP